VWTPVITSSLLPGSAGVASISAGSTGLVPATVRRGARALTRTTSPPMLHGRATRDAWLGRRLVWAGSPPSPPLLIRRCERGCGFRLVDVGPTSSPTGSAAPRAGRMLDAHTEIVDNILAQIARLGQVTAAARPVVYSSRPAGGFALTGRRRRGVVAPGAARHGGLSIPVPDTSCPGTNRVALAETVGRRHHEWPARALCAISARGRFDHPGGKPPQTTSKRVHELGELGGSRAVRLGALVPRHLRHRRLPPALLPLDRRAGCGRRSATTPRPSSTATRLRPERRPTPASARRRSR